jgi:hypothetical protein
MELEIEGLTGAAYGERGLERSTSAMAIATGCGRRTPTRELRIRKLRKGSYFSDFLEPRRLAEKVGSEGGLCAWRKLGSCCDPLLDDACGHLQARARTT